MPVEARALLRRLGNRRAIFLLLALVGLLGGLHLGTEVVLRRAEQAANEAALTRLALRAEAAEQVMNRLMEGWDSYFEMMQDRERLAVTGSPLVAGIDRRLVLLSEARRFGVIQAGVIGPDGVSRWSSVGGTVEVNLADRPHFVAHLRQDSGLYVSEPLLGRITGRWTLQISRRITNAVGSFSGVAVLSVEPDFLKEQFAALGSEAGRSAALFRDDGVLLASSTPAAPLLAQPFVTPHRVGPSGEARFRAITSRNNVDSFVALRRLSGLPLIVGVSSPAATELADHALLRRSVRQTEVALALLVLAGFGLATLLRLRRQAEQDNAAAQSARAELVRVLDGLGAVVFLQWLYPDGSFRRDYISAEATRVLGVQSTDQTLLHQALDSAALALPPEHRLAAYERLRREGTLTLDLLTLLPDGSHRWVRNVVNVIGQDGDALEVVGLMSDVSAEKAAEVAREEASQARLQVMARVLNGLAATTFVSRLYPDGSFHRDYVNPNIHRLLGMPAAEPEDAFSLLDRTQPPITTQERAELHDILRHHGHLSFDRQLRLPDGTLRWVRCAINVIGQVDEELELVGLITDIDAEKAAAVEREQRDKARLQELHGVLDGIEGAVFLSSAFPDGTQRRDYMNAGAARLLRLADGTLYTDNYVLTHLEPPLDQAERVRRFDELRRDGLTMEDRQLRCADNTLRWVRTSIRVLGEEGDGLKVVGLITDIETEKAAEAAAISHARLATLGEMASGLAHEMNQPLGVISLTAETANLLLQQDPVANQQEVKVLNERIFAMTRRAKEVIDHLRLFARQQEATMEAVALRDVVEGALLMTAGTLREHGVVLEQDLPATLPAVRGRQVMLEQVLLNLLLNADHAMASMPPERRRLRISARAEGAQVTLQVSDSGPGLPPEVLPRLFEPFFTTKPPGEGTGLGLSICHGILKACGGQICAANGPHGGAVFTLKLQAEFPGVAPAVVPPSALPPPAVVPAAVVPAA